ncbi:MAG: hypothetical protein ACLR1T_10240 [Evtepia gabavorous]
MLVTKGAVDVMLDRTVLGPGEREEIERVNQTFSNQGLRVRYLCLPAAGVHGGLPGGGEQHALPGSDRHDGPPGRSPRRRWPTASPRASAPL